MGGKIKKCLDNDYLLLINISKYFDEYIK